MFAARRHAGFVIARAHAICRTPFTACHRTLSSTAAARAQEIKKWSDTLLLPKTAFPMKLKDPVGSEARFHEKTSTELYRQQWKSNEGPVFVLHDGPPYANGNIHMGHAMNKVLKDFINRYKASRGYRVNYIPGWDCHGMPIEHKALKNLGKSHLELSPSEIRNEARKMALEAIETQKEEFRQLGIMADWDAHKGTYRTLDHDFELRQIGLLKRMLERGLLQHRKRPTYYSPSSRTALAEAELSYDDNHKSQSVYVYFKVPQDGMSPALAQLSKDVAPGEEIGFAIWTTTAWTLPANMAVLAGQDIVYCLARQQNSGRILVVAEARLEDLQSRLGSLDVLGRIQGEWQQSLALPTLADPRRLGKDLLGTEYEHLFWHKGLPRSQVIPSADVTTTAGTGLVHSAPGHGKEDYAAFRLALKNEKDFRCPVDDEGKLTADIRAWTSDDSIADRLVGKNVLGDAVPEMISILRETGILLAEEKIAHKYPCDWKTKEPVIVRATPQWFANVEGVKTPAIEAMDHIEFKPEQSRRRLEAFVTGRSEWCISRQRSWGLPIPSLHDLDTGEVIMTPESLDHIISVLADKGTDHWWSDEVTEFVPESLRHRTFRKGTDTMDVWFDSGSSWTLIKELALRDDGDESIADVYLEGSDQHRGWFQSSLLTSLCSAEEEGKFGVAPYKTLITHGFVLDQEGKKMSKSVGNIISPSVVVKGGKNRQKEPAYGADVLRLWAASVEYSRDVNLGATSLSHASENMRRIRNAIKYLLGNTSRAPVPRLTDVDLNVIDRYVLHELASVERAAIEAYESYTFSKVIQAINVFNTNVLSSVYVEAAKDSLYCDLVDGSRRQAIVAVLAYILQRTLYILRPILPHLVEEVSQESDMVDGSSLWENDAGTWTNKEVEATMAPLMAVRHAFNQLIEEARVEKRLKTAGEASLRIVTSNEALRAILDREAAVVKMLLSAAQITTAPAVDPPWILRGDVVLEGKTIASVELSPSTAHKCPRCWLHQASELDSLCQRCSDVVVGK